MFWSTSNYFTHLHTHTHKKNLFYIEKFFAMCSGQEFAYLVVLDFESTCWEAKWCAPQQEIIEFPAILLNLQSGEIVSEFQQYVMPIEQPVLSPFCTTLTGREAVDGLDRKEDCEMLLLYVLCIAFVI